MMGTKERAFAPLPAVTLADLVPADHFYRHLEHALDLGFVRDLVRDRYAAGGRPSVDPIVFFKLQLITFFEGMRSERQLMAVAADRLSLRWYLGNDLGERLPDHSSLTKIRALRPRRLPAFLRCDRRAVPRGRPGLGGRALPRRDPGGGQRRPRLGHAALRGGGASHSTLPRRGN